ncbi:hypothetical protein Scep_026999 [Stephania cephalantha]|uniref:Uncharacterized protein n=1 Tax=Stephania cephalantha TaxID=152367 RepID=A0AAP0EL68_9MAGN
MSFAIYDAWCRKASIRYTGNIYLIAKKRITPIYLTEEVFVHYKRMRATDEAFKKKSEQMSSNRKSEVGGPGTGISLHSAGSISARQHGDTLEKKLQRRPTRKEMFRHLHTHGHDRQSFVDQRSAKIDAELTRRLEEMSTQTPNTSIDEDVVYLEVVPEVRGRVYGLGSQGYHRNISLGEASSSRGPAYGPHELEELKRDHQRLQETLLNERMERQEQMQRDKMEHQEETREMQDRLARMEALLMQHLGNRHHVPPTPQTPPSPVTERSGPQSDDHPGHLTTRIAPSQSAHRMTIGLGIGPLHIKGCLRINVIFWMIMMSLWSILCRLRDHRHDKSDWMSYLFLWYVHRWHLIWVLHREAKLNHQLGFKFQRFLWIWMGHALLAPEFVWCLSCIGEIIG